MEPDNHLKLPVSKYSSLPMNDPHPKKGLTPLEADPKISSAARPSLLEAADSTVRGKQPAPLQNKVSLSKATGKLKSLNKYFSSYFSASKTGSPVRELAEAVSTQVSGGKKSNKSLAKLNEQAQRVLKKLEGKRDRVKNDFESIGADHWDDLTPVQKKKLATMNPEKFLNRLDPKLRDELNAGHLIKSAATGAYSSAQRKFQENFNKIQKRLYILENANIPDAQKQQRIIQSATTFERSGLTPSTENIQRKLNEVFGNGRVPDLNALERRINTSIHDANTYANAGPKHTAEATKALINARDAYYTLSGAIGDLETEGMMKGENRDLFDFARAVILKPLTEKLDQLAPSHKEVFSVDTAFHLKRQSPFENTELQMVRNFEYATSSTEVDKLYAKYGAKEIAHLQERVLMSAMSTPDRVVTEERLGKLAMIKEQVKKLPPEARALISQRLSEHNEIYRHYRSIAETAYALSEWNKLNDTSDSWLSKLSNRLFSVGKNVNDMQRSYMIAKQRTQLNRLSGRLKQALKEHRSATAETLKKRFDPDQYMLASHLENQMNKALMVNPEGTDFAARPVIQCDFHQAESLIAPIKGDKSKQTPADVLIHLAGKGLIENNPDMQQQLLSCLIEAQTKPNLEREGTKADETNARLKGLQETRTKELTEGYDPRLAEVRVINEEIMNRRPDIWFGRAEAGTPVTVEECRLFAKQYANSFEALGNAVIMGGNAVEATRLITAYDSLLIKMKKSNSDGVLNGSIITLEKGAVKETIDTLRAIEFLNKYTGKNEIRGTDKEFSEGALLILQELADINPTVCAKIVQSPAIAAKIDAAKGLSLESLQQDIASGSPLRIPLSLSIAVLRDVFEKIRFDAFYPAQKALQEQRPGAWNMLTGQTALHELNLHMQDLRTPDKLQSAQIVLTKFKDDYINNFKPILNLQESAISTRHSQTLRANGVIDFPDGYLPRIGMTDIPREQKPFQGERLTTSYEAAIETYSALLGEAAQNMAPPPPPLDEQEEPLDQAAQPSLIVTPPPPPDFDDDDISPITEPYAAPSVEAILPNVVKYQPAERTVPHQEETAADIASIPLATFPKEKSMQPSRAALFQLYSLYETREPYLDMSMSQYFEELINGAVQEAEEAAKVNAVPSVYCRMIFKILKNNSDGSESLAAKKLKDFWNPKNKSYKSSTFFSSIAEQFKKYEVAFSSLEKAKVWQKKLGDKLLAISESEIEQARPIPTLPET